MFKLRKIKPAHIVTFIILTVVFSILGILKFTNILAVVDAPTNDNSVKMFPSKMELDNNGNIEQHNFQIVSPIWECDNKGHHTILANDGSCGLDKPCVFPEKTNNDADGIGTVKNPTWIRITTTNGKVYDWDDHWSWAGGMSVQ